MKNINVLFVLGSMEIGGVQSGIMNFAKLVPKNIHIDVLVHNDKIGFHEEEYKKYGTVYHIPLIKNKTGNKLAGLFAEIINNFVFRKKLAEFLKKHRYDVVHSKSLGLSASATEAAKTLDVPVRIAQSHVDKPDRLSYPYELYYKWCAKRIEKTATHKLAVSEKAVNLMFGKFGGKVIQNPTINLKRLDPKKYSPKKHDGINFIQIGTFSRRKNQCFSVDIINELTKKGIDSHLIFVGFPLDEPDYINQIKAKINSFDLNDRIEFLPKDSDVPKLLSENDYMLLPSLREGLPNVALESQAMGVPVFTTENIFKETDCGLCKFLSLDKGAEYWAEQILEYRKINGTEKKFVDMSKWDNEEIIKEYIKIWSNE